jgi:dynactin complex subunit
VDDLTTENAALKTKVEGLAVEATQLRADQAKAKELVDKRQAEAETKERNLQQRLQATLDSLHSKFLACSN